MRRRNLFSSDDFDMWRALAKNNNKLTGFKKFLD